MAIQAFQLDTENKPFFADNTDAMNALEFMIDTVGLSNVLYAIEHVCYAKAEHIQENWQDRTLAKAWSADARTARKAGTLVCSDS